MADDTPGRIARLPDAIAELEAMHAAALQHIPAGAS